MDKQTAHRIAEDILRNDPPGTEIAIQTDGQIRHPHGVDHHVDAWRAKKEYDGSITVEKLHTV